MKRFMLLATLCLFMASTSAHRAGQSAGAQTAGPQPWEYRQKACWDKAETQAGLRHCAAEDFRIADAKMNAVYRDVLAHYTSQPEKLERIKKAQQAWLAFRRLQGEALYPEGDWFHFGQFVRICRNDEMARMSVQRAHELKAFLTSSDDDVCAQDPDQPQ